MDDYPNRSANRQRSRDSFERKMDRWIQTGRQVVDGVAGNRPGQRRGDQQDVFNRNDFDNVGRWVGDKLDWFFEDENDWIENSDSDEYINNDFASSKKKRPLRAISLRAPKALSPQINTREINDSEELWPDSSSFKVNRWERKNSDLKDYDSNTLDKPRSQVNSKKRQLPRSNRSRRN